MDRIHVAGHLECTGLCYSAVALVFILQNIWSYGDTNELMRVLESYEWLPSLTIIRLVWYPRMLYLQSWEFYLFPHIYQVVFQSYVDSRSWHNTRFLKNKQYMPSALWGSWKWYNDKEKIYRGLAPIQCLFYSDFIKINV